MELSTWISTYLIWGRALRAADEYVIEGAVRALRSVPLVVDLGPSSSVAVLGDVHGFDDVVERFEELADEYGVDKAVMLGDYVDRGPSSLQTIIDVLRLVTSDPQRFIAIRGDHEDPRMNESYGFYEEVLYMQAEGLYQRVVDAYSHMPIAAVGMGAFMAHGGIPCMDCSRPDVPLTLEQLRSYSDVKGTRRYLRFDDPVLLQIAWNDPDPSAKYFESDVRGPGIYYYGRLAWSSFLKANRLRLIVRGHEVVDGFMAYRRDGRPLTVKCDQRVDMAELDGGVVTVFSSRYHGGRSGALIVDEDGMTLKCL